MVLATTAFLLATLGAGTGVESQDPEHLGWVVSPGALLGLRSGRAFDAAGELSLIASKGRFSIGAVFGSAIHTHSFELQPTASIGGDVHGVILGLNPGVVLDRTADSPRIGFQATLWAWPWIGCGHACVLPIPIPFVRLRSFAGGENVWIAGLALKIPWPISGE
jgi:hypothetical protein